MLLSRTTSADGQATRGSAISATVTTDHSMSSYNQPGIVLDEDGDILDALSWNALGYAATEATSEETKLLSRIPFIGDHPK